MKRVNPARIVVFIGLFSFGAAGAALREGEPRPLWANVESLATPRYEHAAVLLADGRVLVAGGADAAGNTLSSVELYDPLSRTWSAGSAMHVARRSFTVTRLDDGRVLAVGGTHEASAEIFNPLTSKWTLAPSMSSVRDGHTVSVVQGGVLVAGGVDLQGSEVATAEKYDPAPQQNKWSPAGDLIAPRSGHAASLLSDGKVLLVGGQAKGAWLSDVEVFDPATGVWSVTTDLGVKRGQCAASVLSNGRVLVSGGFDGSASLAVTELYNPANSKWTTVAALNGPRKEHTSTELKSLRILVAGGRDTDEIPLSSAEIYDPGLDQWSDGGDLEEARFGHTAVLLENGKVLFTGGKNAAGEVVGSVEEFSTGGLCADVNCPPPGPCEEKGTCNPLDGQCSYPRKADGIACQSPNKCIESSACEAGICVGAVKTCPGDVCHGEGVCDPVDGVCKSAPDYCAGGVESKPFDVGASCDSPERKERCAAKGGICAREGDVEICCPEACDPCHSCALPGHLGECWPEEGVDFRGECGAGACIQTCSGKAGGCVNAEKGTQCVTPRCLDRSRRLGPAACVAYGEPCPPAVEEDCGFYACDSVKRDCLTACESVNDCAAGYVCNIGGRCVAPVPVAQGFDPTCALRAETRGSGGAWGIAGLALLAVVAVRRRRGS